MPGTSVVERLVNSDVLDSSALDAELAQTLPRECYTSQEFYEYEQEVIWRKDWVCLGHVKQIPRPGDFFTMEMGSDPFIVIRGRDGAISAFSNVCQHRGMIIAEGAGTCDKLLVCPYHNWSYDMRGKLVGAPDMSKTRDFDRSRISLPALKTEIWHGFIFGTYDQKAEPLGPRMKEFEPYLENFDLDSLELLQAYSYTYDANWKLGLENGLECYHCSRLHRNTLACMPSRNSILDPLPHSDPGLVIQVKATHKDATMTPPDYKALFPVLPKLTDDERHLFTLVAVLPSLVLSCGVDSVHYFSSFPMGPAKTQTLTGWLFPSSTLELPDFKQLFDYQVNVHKPIIDEDNFACMGVQRGMQSGFAPRGRLSWQEDHIAHVNRWVVSRYKQTANGAAHHSNGAK